jgi:hypothetical protein
MRLVLVSHALACVFRPEDAIEAIISADSLPAPERPHARHEPEWQQHRLHHWPSVQIRFLREGGRVHKQELKWQRVKLEREAEQELAVQRRRHDELAAALQRQVADLTCAAFTLATYMHAVLLCWLDTMHAVQRRRLDELASALQRQVADLSCGPVQCCCAVWKSVSWQTARAGQSCEDLTCASLDCSVRHREEVAEVLRRAQHQKSQYSEKLEEQKDWIETRLVREVARTDAVEAEMEAMRTKFAGHLQKLEGLQAAAAGAAAGEKEAMAADMQARRPRVACLSSLCSRSGGALSRAPCLRWKHAPRATAGAATAPQSNFAITGDDNSISIRFTVQKLAQDAGAVLEQQRAQSDLEMLLEARLNEDDLEKANARMCADATERDARYMKLFEDFQMQMTHLARAHGEARAERARADGLEADKAKLADAVKRLEARC